MMRNITRSKVITVCAMIASLMGGALANPSVAAAAPPNAPEVPQAPLDTPDTLVGSGVGDYTVAAPKVFWHLRTCDQKPPALANATAATNAPNAPVIIPDSESISRIAVQGSEIRQLYSASVAGFCGALAHIANANMVADANYLYWVTDQGLVRLSTNANPGDTPQVFNKDLTSYYAAELAIDSDSVYVLTKASNSTSILNKVNKSNGAATLLRNIGAFAGELQVSHAFSFGVPSYSGDYVYWIDGGVLRRLNLNTSAIDNVASGVTQYYAEGGRFSCSIIVCFSSDTVYLSTGRYLFTANNKSLGSVTQIYDAGSADDTIYSIVTDANHVFFLQEHTVPCSPQPCFGGTYTDFVIRHGRGASGTADTLSTSRIENLTPRSVYRNITTANGYLMWQADSTILRLPNDAAALPLTNMRVTGMSITQGIQKGSGAGVENSVLLIQGRRTFVRMFVKSDGPNVAGVTARLYRTNSGGTILDSVLPVNSVGTNITVRSSPNRANLNDSFLFELPWSWLPSNTDSKLYLRAELNPFHAPVESSYADNALASGAQTFYASAALKVQFIAWGYTIGGTTYYPRFVKDIIQTYSWLIRAYPIASKITFDGAVGSQPGLHPNLWFQYDSTLGARVNQTFPGCTDNLCASGYADTQMGIMRSDNGLPESRFFYGFISDAAGFFPRGQACCAANVSTGPAGSGTWGWDYDGSYADWYAAHEIGHTLGRAHPTPSAMPCGNSASDNSYPYTGGQIGANNNAEGFDAGDSAYGVPRAIYPGTSWYDVMSYCNNQWVSDYTYVNMWAHTILYPSLAMVALAANDAGATALAKAQPRVEPDAVKINGDFLQVYGKIYSGSATIDQLWRTPVVNATTPITPGGYSIRLLDASNAQLADYPFAANNDDEAGYATFGQIVTFTTGTRSVKVMRTSDGATLATKAISANAPLVSNVALQGAPDPVTGTVTLSWSASDADGDPLTFDVRYSHDGGATWVTVHSGATGNSASIDTSTLGGGTGQFRVVASDGANTGQADSASFSMADKPPMPMILTPNTGLHIHYGQLVNFSGAAMDWQDGGVTGANLVWSSDLAGALGTGEQISSQNLAVGTHTITLSATNSKNLTASTSITVIVDDDLNLLGPTLTAGPLQFDWNFAVNATTTISDVLHISNAGEGTLNWTASADVSWLALSATSGTDAADVTLTADPSSLTNGSSVSGTLMLTSPAVGDVPTQTMQIHVSLSKGFDPLNPANFQQPIHVWLPLLSRN